MKTKSEKTKTTLSSYFWREKEALRNPKVTWAIMDEDLDDYNPNNDICRLCTREKFTILFEPEKASLNTRQEIFGCCRHKDPRLLGKPPDRRGK